mmetsp:Transcript_4341/g.6301  ORF Transcript_4341/g.6301 Transcript_4341/m.6301 type:complete len:174 (+) Transcript_4341:92-613(+)
MSNENLHEDEEVLVASSQSKMSEGEDKHELDEIVGLLESILVEDSFLQLQNDFCKSHCDEFDDTGENKLVYTDIFSEYTHMIESYIKQKLEQRFQNVSVDEVASVLMQGGNEVTSDVLDMLFSFTDFEEFKGLMLSYKREEVWVHFEGITTSVPRTSAPLAELDIASLDIGNA